MKNGDPCKKCGAPIDYGEIYLGCGQEFRGFFCTVCDWDESEDPDFDWKRVPKNA